MTDNNHSNPYSSYSSTQSYSAPDTPSGAQPHAPGTPSAQPDSYSIPDDDAQSAPCVSRFGMCESEARSKTPSEAKRAPSEASARRRKRLIAAGIVGGVALIGGICWLCTDPHPSDTALADSLTDSLATDSAYYADMGEAYYPDGSYGTSHRTDRDRGRDRSDRSDRNRPTRFDEGRQTYREGRQTLHEGREAVAEGRQAYRQGREAYREGKEIVREGKEAIREGKEMVREGKEALAKGQKTITKGKKILKEANQIADEVQSYADGRPMPTDAQGLAAEGQRLLDTHPGLESKLKTLLNDLLDFLGIKN